MGRAGGRGGYARSMSDLIADPETDAAATYAVDPGLGPPARPRGVVAPRAPSRAADARPVHRCADRRAAACPRPTTSRSPSTAPAPRSGPGRGCRTWPTAARCLLRLHDLVLDAPGRPARPDPDRERQVPRARVRGDPGRRDRRPALRPAGAVLPAPAPASGCVPRALPVDRAAPAQGRRRHRRALELPAHPVASPTRCPRCWPATPSSSSRTRRPC